MSKHGYTFSPYLNGQTLFDLEVEVEYFIEQDEGELTLEVRAITLWDEVKYDFSDRGLVKRKGQYHGHLAEWIRDEVETDEMWCTDRMREEGWHWVDGEGWVLRH